MRKILTLFSLIFFVLLFTSCVFTYKLNVEDIEKKDEIVEYKETPQHEIVEYTLLDLPEHLMTAVDSIPEKDFFTVSPVGENPVYYVFYDSMTIYGYDKWTEQYSKCTLNLPEDFSEGSIIYASGGAGSGEVEMIVSAIKDGQEKFLSYFFFAGNEKGYLCPMTTSLLSHKPQYIK